MFNHADKLIQCSNALQQRSLSFAILYNWDLIMMTLAYIKIYGLLLGKLILY